VLVVVVVVVVIQCEEKRVRRRVEKVLMGSTYWYQVDVDDSLITGFDCRKVVVGLNSGLSRQS
jgi:hypothetical protein